MFVNVHHERQKCSKVDDFLPKRFLSWGVKTLFVGVSRGQVCSVECFAGWAVLANEGSAGWSYVTLAGTRRDSLARARDRFLARSLGGVGFYLHKELRAREMGFYLHKEIMF